MPLNMQENTVIYRLILDKKSIVACHKAGIMKMGDGLFIDTAAEVAKGYP